MGNSAERSLSAQFGAQDIKDGRLAESFGVREVGEQLGRAR